MLKQGSPEWFAQRLGKVTASRVSDVLATTKSGPAASRTNYMMELLCQRLTGSREEGFTSAAMQRGTDLEPVARAAYELTTTANVREAGFIVHPECDGTGASPDGFVGDDGLIEIKCPNTAQHVACLQSSKPDTKYINQMQHQMACTERQWCDFVSYDDRMPEPLQFFCVRVLRDDVAIASMMEKIRAFLAELDALEQQMIQKIEAA